MYWDVVEVRVEPECALWVRFADGTSGRVRFLPEFFTGLFEPLRDPVQFAGVYLDRGAVAWPGGLDLAPDAMYEEIRKKEEWVLGGDRVAA